MSLVLEVSLHDLWIFIARHRRPVFLNLRGTEGEGKLKSLFVVVGKAKVLSRVERVMERHNANPNDRATFLHFAVRFVRARRETKAKTVIELNHKTNDNVDFNDAM